MWSAQCCVLLSVCGVALGLYCYDCTESQQETNHCAGVFGTGDVWFNASRLRLANCTGENAMCFVRSWSARAKHAWLVQRGCYQSRKDDPLPRTVRNPTRSMACKRERKESTRYCHKWMKIKRGRYRDAEYRVCLCQADWCNSAKSTERHKWIHFSIVVGIAASSVIRYLYLSLQLN